MVSGQRRFTKFMITIVSWATNFFFITGKHVCLIIIGDIGKVDKDGFLYIVDRLKELIKYKGYQVAPASLEDILLRHHAVADVGVVGVPDEEAGELPIAYVVKKLGMHVSKKELQDFVAGNFEICVNISLPTEP